MKFVWLSISFVGFRFFLNHSNQFNHWSSPNKMFHNSTRVLYLYNPWFGVIAFRCLQHHLQRFKLLSVFPKHPKYHTVSLRMLPHWLDEPEQLPNYTLNRRFCSARPNTISRSVWSFQVPRDVGFGDHGRHRSHAQFISDQYR